MATQKSDEKARDQDGSRVGEPDADARETEIEETFYRLEREGRTRLARPWPTLFTTALVGGIDIGTGVFAYLVVEHQTGNKLLASLAFSIGFVALLLARSELFTENFLLPVVSVVAGRSGLYSLVRLWVATLVFNLVGCWIMAWLIIEARPDLKPTAIETGSHYADLGITLHSLALAVLAGIVITLMTRMQSATDNLGVQLVPAILFGALLAGGQLFHSILDSLFMFAALHSGAPFGYLDWLGALGWSVLGNLIGGVGVVTFLRLIRVPGQLAEERERSGRRHGTGARGRARTAATPDSTVSGRAR
jgi:formate/nitrite transporter FocA (FNT family)